MWEEDPRWQSAQFKVVAVGLALLVLVRLGFAAFGWSWDPQSFDSVLLGFGVALGVYAAIIWLVGWILRAMLRRFGKKDGSDS